MTRGAHGAVVLALGAPGLAEPIARASDSAARAPADGLGADQSRITDLLLAHDGRR